MKISIYLNDKFYQLTAFGLGITYIFQVFLTIGGGTKFIPLTGVTLPLISYGGSSVLTTLILFSITEGLSIIHEEEQVIEQNSKKIRIKKKRKKTIKYTEDDIINDYEGEALDNEQEPFNRI